MCEYKYNVTGRHFTRQGDIALRQFKSLPSDVTILCKHVLSKFTQSNISPRLGTVIKNRKKRCTVLKLVPERRVIYILND